MSRMNCGTRLPFVLIFMTDDHQSCRTSKAMGNTSARLQNLVSLSITLRPEIT